MIALTRDSIKTDIRAFAQRLAEAQHKLSELPATASNYKERRKIKTLRHKLRAEIEHVKRLISCAEEAVAVLD
jgi:chromosome segregation ATPase